MEKLFTFKDAPMFKRVMKDPDLCRGVIESILGIKIDEIVYQGTEEEMEPYVDGRGVRFDAYVKATGKIFDIEIQTVPEPALGHRMRYYQSAMDAASLKRGSAYDELDESFVIFICSYDHYGYGVPVYLFDRIWYEDRELNAGDESHWLVLNSTAWDKDDDAPRANLLEYIHNGKASDELTERLAQAVKEANDDAEWREHAMGFMTLEHHYAVRERAARKEGRTEGVEQGIEQGEERYSKLIDILLGEQRIDDLKRVADDPEYRQQLFKEYSL